MTGSGMPSYLIAFGSGLVSFFTPCVLPLIPVYLSFITGLSADQLKQADGKTGISSNLKETLGGTLLFVLGFSAVFIALGASATFLSNFLFANKKLISVIGGIIVIIFGLQIAGVFNIKFLEYEKKIQLKGRPVRGFGSFIIGLVFAIGWTPCIGPILGSILAIAATKETVGQGITLLSFYSLGLAVPFIITSIFVGLILSAFTKIRKYLKLISIISGAALVVVGAGIIFGFIRF